MTAASAYTPTDSGWGLWFLVAVVVLATVAVGVAWGSTTALVQLRSWLDGLAVGTEVER